MTGGPWHPEQDLTALLDALTDELLAAPAGEMTASLREVGEDPDDAVRAMRQLVATSPPCPAVPRVAGLSPPPLRATAPRMQ